jgi:uncharacterized protein
MTKIIGRKRELQQLEEAYKAEESLFVVVYGRRRVGKTFLVREACDLNQLLLVILQQNLNGTTP